MDASGVQVAAPAGLRHRGGKHGANEPDLKHHDLTRGTIPPTKPPSSPLAPFVDGVWYVWTYLCAMFGLVLVDPTEFVAMCTCSVLTPVMIYGLIIYGVLLAFYHFPNYTVLAFHRMYYYLTGEHY